MAIGLGAAMLGSAAIGGGSSFLGSMFGQSSSAKQAKKQMDFQREMSNTAYTRAVADMRNAGLNPVLAAGSPASTPSGAMGQTPDYGGNISRAASAGANTAMQYKSTKANVAKVTADAKVSEAEAGINKGMLDYYNSLPPKTKNAQSAAMLARRSGINPIGAAAAEVGASSAVAARTSWDNFKRTYGGYGKAIWKDVKRRYEQRSMTPKQKTYDNTGRIRR